MKKIFIVLILFFSSIAFAAKVNAPFFKVEKNGEVSYMLGTIHTGVEYSSLPQQIQDLAAQSDALIVETDISAAPALVAQTFPPGAKDSLKNQLTDEEWAKFTAVAEPLLGPQAPFIMDRLHPAMAISIFSSGNFPETKEPLDQHLVNIYNQSKKPIYYLEDIAVQLNVMIKTQTIETLKAQLQVTQAMMDQQTQLMLFIYSQGNLQLIEQFLVSPMPQDQLNLLLIDRNLAWQQKFDSLFNKPGQEFFAFGAAHLVTEYGMIKLVEDLGYTVTQLKY